MAGNPFEEAERLILADLAKWKQGTFTVARELYEGDENLCQAIENAIWVSSFVSFFSCRVDLTLFYHCCG
ncbi:hypothetical protein EON65_07855 [archaeon]|nr:MAG: hypothetical protein EON65_07855 [archaeon]